MIEFRSCTQVERSLVSLGNASGVDSDDDPRRDLAEGGYHLGEHLRWDHAMRRDRERGHQRGQGHRNEEAYRDPFAGHQRGAG